MKTRLIVPTLVLRSHCEAGDSEQGPCAIPLGLRDLEPVAESPVRLELTELNNLSVVV